MSLHERNLIIHPPEEKIVEHDGPHDAQLDDSGMNTAPEAQTAWLDRDDYDQTIEVLATMGLAKAELATLPTFEQLNELVTPELTHFMGDKAYQLTSDGKRQPLQPELTVDVNFGNTQSFDTLVQRLFPNSFVDPIAQRQYETAANQATRRFRFGLYIADLAKEATGQPAASGVASWLQRHKLGFLAQDEIASDKQENEELKRGLLGLGLTPPEQLRKIQAEPRHASIYYEPGVAIGAMTLSQYLVLQAKRQALGEAGPGMLDTDYIQTVFPGYAPIQRGTGRLGTERVPVAHWTGEGLHVATTGNHYGDERQGARRVASLILPYAVTGR